MMLLKQLKQFTLSATRRNAVFATDVKWLTRFYGSPAVCQPLTTSKVPKKMSRDDRRALVESFVNEYRATNDGKFPSLNATHKKVGGSYYIVKVIFQELKLKPKVPVPIVAKGLSEVSPSVPNDPSSQSLNDPQSHGSACNAEHISPVVVDPVFQAGSPNTIETGSDHSSPPLPNDASSQSLNDPQSHSSACNAEHISHVVVDPVIQAGGPDTIEIGSDQRRATIDSSRPNSDESYLQGNNLVITATHDKGETETALDSDVGSKWDSNTHLADSQKRIVSDECLKNSKTEEEENLMPLGSQELKADHLEGAAVSETVVPSETRQVSERGTGEVKTGERSSAWSNIMSFAKEFANYWRKG